MEVFQKLKSYIHARHKNLSIFNPEKYGKWQFSYGQNILSGTNFLTWKKIISMIILI